MLTAKDGRVRVRVGRSSGCSACDAGKGCGAGVFGRLLERKPVVLEIDNTVDAFPGQGVVVGLPESVFLALVLRLYLYPLLAGLAGAAAGHALASWFAAGDLWVDASALLLALAAGFFVAIVNRRRPVEFPGESVVHLLRTVECEVLNK